MRQDDRLFFGNDTGSTSSGSPLHSSAMPLRGSCDAACRVISARREQCFGPLLSGCSISKPAVLNSLVVFGTEDIQNKTGNSLFMVDSVFQSIQESRNIPIADGAVCSLAFVADDGLVAVGISGGQAVLVQASEGFNRPVPFTTGHSDDIRDMAVLRDHHKSHLASCSYDGLIVITDLMQGCIPLLMVIGFW